MSKALEAALSGIAAITAEFDDPEDDYAAMAFFEHDDQVTIIPSYQFMENDTTKDLLANFVLPRAAVKLGAETVVLVFSAFGVKIEKPTDEEWEEMPRPGEHPDRVEMLIVTEMNADGVQRSLVAYIDRDPFMKRPPTLTEFEENFGPGTEGAHWEGRFIDPLLAALKEVQES